MTLTYIHSGPFFGKIKLVFAPKKAGGDTRTIQERAQDEILEMERVLVVPDGAGGGKRFSEALQEMVEAAIAELPEQAKAKGLDYEDHELEHISLDLGSAAMLRDAVEFQESESQGTADPYPGTPNIERAPTIDTRCPQVYGFSIISRAFFVATG